MNRWRGHLAVCIASAVLLIGQESIATGQAAVPERANPNAPTTEPDHFYVGRRGDAFEYAKTPINGVDAESRVLVWFLGVRKGGPAVRYQDGLSTGTLTCHDDCQFVLGATTVHGKVTHTGRIHVTNDPLIYAIKRDAQAGRLSRR
jgi:hypothetical protein